MSLLRYVFDYARWKYLCRGVAKRLSQEKICPCCHSTKSRTIDRKLIYRLEQCEQCLIRFRFPYETVEEMNRYYQSDYKQAGLTTGLPTEEQLQELLANSFVGSEKDYSQVIAMLHSLALGKGAKVLDYGANWGYFTLQLQKAGFSAQGYEISRLRAEFAQRLGVLIATDLDLLTPPFDVVYSSHVLEHMPNPLAALREQLSLTRERGFVIAHTPNGSEAYQRAHYDPFHRSWGLPHPVLLTDSFITTNMRAYPCLIAESVNRGYPSELTKWGQRENFIGDLSHQGELLIIICNRPK
ncbi:MAG: class I SAM-dependent methyltransferase [Ktedonobacteraceae bacterium]